MAGQKPRQGWIYIINPYQVSLPCKLGHTHIYNLSEPGELECKTASCTLKINSSRVFRGTHPYVIWTSDQFQDESNYIYTFTVIPLTSQETWKGLPTTYPINPTVKNGLDKKSYILPHQLCTVDANCFKNLMGDWVSRIGQIDKADKEAIQKILKYYLDLQNDNPSDEWFAKNASPELLDKVFGYLSEEDKNNWLEKIIQ